jgi:hypothetical protein
VRRQLRIHEVAVSDRDADVSFHLAEEPAFSGLSATGRSTARAVVMVAARSLDSFTVEHQIARVDALKVDVEGHEADVLRGATALLRRSPDPLVMFEVSAKNLTVEGRASLADALGPLYDAGYCGLVPDLSVGGSLREIASADEAAGLENANVLLVRRAGQRHRQLRAAVARRVGELDTPLLSRQVDDPRELERTLGVDSGLVCAALRDKAGLESRAISLAHQVQGLVEENARLRAERAALRAEIRHIGARPLGLALRALRRLTQPAIEHRDGYAE